MRPMAILRFSATSPSLALSSCSTSCEMARSRTLEPASILAASISPPAKAGEPKPSANASASGLLVILILIQPDFLLGRPIFLVVLDEPLDVQLAEHLRREAAGGHVLDLPLELALLAHHRVDLAQAGAAQLILQAQAQIGERLLDQL